MYANWAGNFILTRHRIYGAAMRGRFDLRKCTPVECERLQTVPDNYTSCVSDSQRYKMLGNGWTVDVVAHIFSGLSVADQGVLFGKVA